MKKIDETIAAIIKMKEAGFSDPKTEKEYLVRLTVLSESKRQLEDVIKELDMELAKVEKED